MIAMNYYYFSYREKISYLCDVHNLPEKRFLELYDFIKQSNNTDTAVQIVLESMSHFKSKLDQINMDLANLGLLKRVTYEEL